MAALRQSFELAIIGGGPAGLAPLLAAHKASSLDRLLSKGVAVIERDDTIGSGQIGTYGIRSDSAARAFVDCLNCEPLDATTAPQRHPLAYKMLAAGDDAVPLRDVGTFLRILGEAVGETLEMRPNCAVMTQHQATSAQQVRGGWRVAVLDLATRRTRFLTARQLLIATGGHQPAARLATEKLGTRSLSELAGNRLLQSGEVLREGGVRRVEAMIAGKKRPRVAILGGSTSAAAVAHVLLHRLPADTFVDASVSILHRRPLRIFYHDRAAALADNYTEWTERDVCKISGRVFRFAGFRLDSRELIMRARGIGGRPPEPRLHLHQVRSADPEALRIIAEADVVIAAIGYRPRALPLYDHAGHPIPLGAHSGPQKPMVDEACRVVDTCDRPIPNVYGIGLAAGFVPHGRLGGEESFRGQANGLWLWQHDIGAMIADSIIRTAESARVSPVDARPVHVPQLPLPSWPAMPNG
jgi:hypothetical protein